MSERVLDFWARLVKKYPRSPALFEPDGNTVNFAALEKRSEQLKEQWIDEGMKERRIIALNLSNGKDWVVGFLACLKLKAVVVPIDPGFSVAEIEKIARELKAQAMWNGSTLSKGFATKPYVFKKRTIEVGKLTSGSTGRSKKLFFASAEMIEDARNLINSMGIRPDDVNLGLIPWGHSYGLGSIVYPLLLQGTRVAWTETPFPNEIGAVCKRAKCTLFPSVPTVIRALIRSDCEPTKFESLRLVISAGARLDPAIAQAFLDRFGKRVHNFYGSTETGGISFDDTGDAALTGRSVGKPIAGVSIVPTKGNRFYVKSSAVYSYGNRKRSLTEVPQALVADKGRIDSRGELVLESRAVNLMKIGARRINPLDIERQLLSIEGVSDAKVFPIDRDGDAIVAAAIESGLSRNELGRLIKDVVPLRLRPKKWLSYDQFPVTARGKTHFASIRADFDS